MTDLEITKRCAEAMGIQANRLKFQPHANLFYTSDDSDKWKPYNPLTDDAQAMGLVKRFTLDCVYSADKDIWAVGKASPGGRVYAASERAPNLNRAICLTIASIKPLRP